MAMLPALYAHRLGRAYGPDSSGAALTRADGMLGEAANGLGLPGLAPERGISASAMGILLGCPQRFLLETVLGLRPPAGRRPKSCGYGSASTHAAPGTALMRSWRWAC